MGAFKRLSAHQSRGTALLSERMKTVSVVEKKAVSQVVSKVYARVGEKKKSPGQKLFHV